MFYKMKIKIIIMFLFASGKCSNELIEDKVDAELDRLDKHQNLLRYSKSNHYEQTELYKDLRSKLAIPLEKLFVIRSKIEGVILDKNQLLNNYEKHITKTLTDLKKLLNGTDHEDITNNNLNIGKLIEEKRVLQKLLVADEKAIQKDIAAISEDYRRKLNEFESIISGWVGDGENSA